VLAHVTDRAWWARLDLTSSLDRIKIPVLYWSGWYDNFTGGELQDFQAARKRRRQGTRPPDGRPLGSRGQLGAHDQGDLHARAADRQAALGHLSAFLRSLSDGIQNGFGGDARVRYFHHRRRSLAGRRNPGRRRACSRPRSI
jgi:hypothetical protein